MFIDEATIQVFGGDGGRGCLSFRREKKVPRGGPDGGDGGVGGSVILVSDPSVDTLLAFRYEKVFRAPRGAHGEGSNRAGRDGRDLEVRVPVGTVVSDPESGASLADLTRPAERFVAARGGLGGRGNARFATATNRAPRRHEPGIPGEQRTLRLELKLLADVGLVGLPNAGKSTLISRVSAARPKIADYPFTTLEPHLGVVRTDDDRSFVVADIPGLIEGAHRGAGLGDRFLRHVERCRLLLHLVDVSDPTRDVVADSITIENELRLYRSELSRKKRILVATKLDAVQDATPVRALAGHARRKRIPFRSISAASGEGIEDLVRTAWRLLRGAS